MLGSGRRSPTPRAQHLTSPGRNRRMATVPTTRWDDLLSSRALIGWQGANTPRRRNASLTESLYEFGGGLPDPASFPHDAMLEATARMLREVGDDAMTYGEPQGYLGL